MESNDEKQARITRALEKVQKALDEEQCELEPFLLVVEGKLVKKEINMIAKPLLQETSSGTVQTEQVAEGEVK